MVEAAARQVMSDGYWRDWFGFSKRKSGEKNCQPKQSHHAKTGTERGPMEQRAMHATANQAHARAGMVTGHSRQAQAWPGIAIAWSMPGPGAVKHMTMTCMRRDEAVILQDRPLTFRHQRLSRCTIPLYTVVPVLDMYLASNTMAFVHHHTAQPPSLARRRPTEPICGVRRRQASHSN